MEFEKDTMNEVELLSRIERNPDAMFRKSMISIELI
jgi:hypothetical protein